MNKKTCFSLAVTCGLCFGILQLPPACAADSRHDRSAGTTAVYTDRGDAKQSAGNLEKTTDAFPKKPSGKWDKRAMQKLTPSEPSAFRIPMLLPSEAHEQTTILGPAAATKEQMIRMIEKRNSKPLLNCSIKELVQIYYEEAAREGIRPDVALCQAIKETGTFQYGGDVLPEQNNYCGLGATGNHVRGASFSTPRLGARAHIQHLLAYASERLPSTPIEDPRYQHILKNRPEIHGRLQRWVDLNGVWAVPGTHYGQDILQLWREARLPDGSDTSLQAAEKMIREAPKDAESYVYRGTVYYAQKNYWLARMDFEQALSLSEQSPTILYDLALSLEALGKKEAALETYRRLLRLDNNFWQASFNCGMLLISQEKYKEAIRDFENVLTRNPQMADAQNEIGVALFKMKKYNDAWDAFYRAHEINSSNPHPKDNMALMYRSLKK